MLLVSDYCSFSPYRLHYHRTLIGTNGRSLGTHCKVIPSCLPPLEEINFLSLPHMSLYVYLFPYPFSLPSCVKVETYSMQLRQDKIQYSGRTIEYTWNGNGLLNGRALIFDTIPAFPERNPRIAWEPSVRIVGVRAEIWILDLQSMEQC